MIAGRATRAPRLFWGGRVARGDPWYDKGSPECAMGRLKVLVLGGTRFLGPEVVRAALARGHAVTLLNRGKTDPRAFLSLPALRGDRDGDMSALEGKTFDTVVDTCAYVPA